MAFQVIRCADKSVRNLDEFVDPPPEKLLIWEAQWKSYLTAKAVGRGSTDHWSWTAKTFVADYEGANKLTFGVEVGGECQGLMQLSWPTPSRLANGVDTTHVEYLEIAPWNRTEVAGERRFDRVGQSLLAMAYDFSETLGHNGRLTLTALPTADSFYHRIKMTQIGVGTGALAALNFFEFDETLAKAFRHG